MKVLRYMAFALGGVVAVLGVLVVAALVVASSFDGAAVKGELASLVREKKQRTLKIDGDLALSFWPQIGFRLGRASLSERDSDARFAAVEGATVSLAILPLFRKEFVVDTLRIEGLHLDLARDKAGTLNIADLIAADDEAPMVRFDIAGIQATIAHVGFRDEKTGQSFSLEQANLSTGSLGNRGRGELVLDGRVKAQGADAKLALRSGYRFDLAAQTLSLDQPSLTLAGALPGVEALDVAASSAGVTLDGQRQDGKLEAVQVALRTRQSGASLEAHLGLPKVALGEGVAKVDAGTLGVKFTGDRARNLDARFTLDGIRVNTAALDIARVKLDAEGRQGEASFRAQASSPLNHDFAAQRLQCSALAGQLDVNAPQQLGKSVRLTFNGNAALRLRDSAAQGQLLARVDESTLKLDWRVPRLSPLAVGFELDVDQLNADKYLVAKPGSARGAASAGANETRLDFSALKGLDLTARMKFGALQGARIKAREVAADLRLNEGTLDARARANLYQGTMEGSLRLAAPNRIALREQLTNVDVGALLKDAFDLDPIEARGSVRFDLTGAGDTVAQLKRSLAGDARVELRDGAIKGMNLPRLVRELRAATPLGASPVTRTEKTEFSQLSATAKIDRGVLRNDDLVFQSPLLRASGAGTVDLAESRVDYLLRVNLAGAAAREAGEAKGLAVPLRVSGSLEAPQVKLAAAEAVRGAAQSQLEQLEQRARSRLGERLKGLIAP